MTAVEPLDRDAALAAAQQIARVAEEVRGVSGRLTSVGRQMGPSVWQAPRTGTRAALSLLRARTSRRGLGLPYRVGALRLGHVEGEVGADVGGGGGDEEGVGAGVGDPAGS